MVKKGRKDWGKKKLNAYLQVSYNFYFHVTGSVYATYILETIPPKPHNRRVIIHTLSVLCTPNSHYAYFDYFQLQSFILYGTRKFPFENYATMQSASYGWLAIQPASCQNPPTAHLLMNVGKWWAVGNEYFSCQERMQVYCTENAFCLGVALKHLGNSR